MENSNKSPPKNVQLRVLWHWTIFCSLFTVIHMQKQWQSVKSREVDRRSQHLAPGDDETRKEIQQWATQEKQTMPHQWCQRIMVCWLLLWMTLEAGSSMFPESIQQFQREPVAADVVALKAIQFTKRHTSCFVFQIQAYSNHRAHGQTVLVS